MNALCLLWAASEAARRAAVKGWLGILVIPDRGHGLGAARFFEDDSGSDVGWPELLGDAAQLGESLVVEFGC